MKKVYQSLIKPVLFNIDAEHAHHLTVKLGMAAIRFPFSRLFTEAWDVSERSVSSFQFRNLYFKNRVGLAAGFDKNAEYLSLMERLGLGFQEIGSITAQASLGNPKPRLFRLPDDEAIVNRMGLNNEGAARIVERLSKEKREYPVGINIAKTHSATIYGDEAVQDYLISFILAEPVADYITINISCPNTEEGKTFEDPLALEQLLKAIHQERKTSKPLLVKLSVDLQETELDELLHICKKYQMDGFVCSNTSSKREKLQSHRLDIERIGKGGLSGKPIKEKSLNLVRLVREKMPDSLIIGVGGITQPEDAVHYLQAGADLIQVFTGLIYYGPSLSADINAAIIQYFHRLNN